MDKEEKQRSYERAQQLLAEQNFAGAVIAGAVATLLGAFLYGVVVARIGIAYGFAAAGVGIVIGLAMQYVGRGIDMKFSIVATVYTLIGCVLGNFFANIGLTPGHMDAAVDVLRRSSLPELAERAVSGLSGTHFVFWFVAVFAGVFFARRALSRADRLALGVLELRE
ncbi:MAG: hypothetical protein EX272_01240 [Chromatiales bacterium]|nr:MAG: hypothetical protein EX272_01240 [Chromatiales bacterium]